MKKKKKKKGKEVQDYIENATLGKGLTIIVWYQIIFFFFVNECVILVVVINSTF